MALTSEGTYFGEGVIWIDPTKNFSVEEMTILSGEDLDTLNIIGKIENAVPTTGTITGTGDGTFTSVTGGKGTKVGAYLLTCVEAFQGGGIFELTDPFGDLVERSKVTAGALTVPATGTADGGNTGNGTVTVVTGDTGSVIGSYLVTCVEALAGGGVFHVTAPNGDLIERVKITAGALTVPSTGTGTGTGNGTMTSVTGDAATVPGTYRVECVETVTNGGVFIVRAPNGDVFDRVEITAGAGGTATIANNQINATLTDGSTDFVEGDYFTLAVTQADSGTGTVANNQLNATITDGSTDFAESDFFTIAITQADGGTGTLANNEVSGTITDGATDFIVGDYFTITVAAGSLKGVELDTTATDGSQKAYGILINTTDASAADTPAAVVVRDALIIADSLDWPSGISGANKAIALTELAAKNIIERTEVL